MLDLHLESIAHRGPWTLSTPRTSGDQVDVRLTGPGGPIPDRTVRLLLTADGRTLLDQQVRTDATGTARVTIPPLDATIAPAVEASTTGPGPRQDWDGAGAVQRMATPTGVVLRAVATLPAPTSTTTSTTVAAIPPTTTVPATVPTVPVPPATAPAPPTTPPPTAESSTTTTVTTTPIDTTAPATPATTSTLAGGETTILGTTTLPATTNPTTTAASSLPAPTTAAPTTTTASPPTTRPPSTTGVTAPVVPPAAPSPAPIGPPPLPRTGSALAGRVADVAAVLLTVGLLLLAAGTGAVARRPRPRDGEQP